MPTNIWNFENDPHTVIVITTNGMRKSNGEAVMGAGIAKQAKLRRPSLPRKLGECLQRAGNHLYYFEEYGLLTFPTKDDWRHNSLMPLILQSARELQNWWHTTGKDRYTRIILPPVGCGYGGLNWSDVKPALLKHWAGDNELLDDITYTED